MRRTICFLDILLGSVVRKKCVGSFSPSGHSTSSHSARAASPFSTGTLTLHSANREESLVFVPCRQVHRRNFFGPRASAISLALSSSPWRWSRRSRRHIVSDE